jgi:dolichyl-phosphate-mannose--protein O-mannosyl transferase
MEETTARNKKRREVIAAILGLVAVVLLWRAIWDMTEAIMSPVTSLIVGLVLIGIIAYLNKGYLKELF